MEEKRLLGLKYEAQLPMMSALDEMSKQYDCSEGLPKELCLEFVKRKPNWRQSTQESYVSSIRVLAEYMIRHDVPAYQIDRRVVTKQHEDYKPYIFSHQQIADIFAVADKIKPTPMNSHIFYPTILRVQYGCGLRISETLGLRMKDVDFNRQVLHVINSKKNKDRDIPVSDSVMEYMKWYKRKIHPAYAPEDYFFKSRYGTGHYNQGTVGEYFRDILFDSDIRRGECKASAPHLHSLRHTFCVHSLEAMLRNGITHQVALPLLMTYMGHASLSATGRYLRLTAEAFPELVQQIDRIYGDIMPDLEVKTEYEDE
jgi:site-specific recombinase XerD